MTKLSGQLILTILFLLLVSEDVYTQYTFRYFPESYEPLSPSKTVLTEDYVWGDDSSMLLPIGFDFLVNDTLVFDSVEFRPSEGYVGFYQQCHFPAGIGAPSGPELLAFTTWHVDRGTYYQSGDTAFSPVSYELAGSPGNRILKFEWINASFASGDWDTWMNFQVWLHETSNILQVRFGKSVIIDSPWTFNPLGPLVSWAYNLDCTPRAYEAIWVYGDKDNPQWVIIDSLNPVPPLTYITGAPDSGMVYEFAPLGVGIGQGLALNHLLKVYPNPVESQTRLTISDPSIRKAHFRLYNLAGQLVHQEPLQYGEVKIFYRESLSSGLYLYTLESSGQIVGRGKMVIK